MSKSSKTRFSNQSNLLRKDVFDICSEFLELCGKVGFLSEDKKFITLVHSTSPNVSDIVKSTEQWLNKSARTLFDEMKKVKVIRRIAKHLPLTYFQSDAGRYELADESNLLVLLGSIHDSTKEQFIRTLFLLCLWSAWHPAPLDKLKQFLTGLEAHQTARRASGSNSVHLIRCYHLWITHLCFFLVRARFPSNKKYHPYLQVLLIRPCMTAVVPGLVEIVQKPTNFVGSQFPQNNMVGDQSFDTPMAFCTASFMCLSYSVATFIIERNSEREAKFDDTELVSEIMDRKIADVCASKSIDSFRKLTYETKLDFLTKFAEKAEGGCNLLSFVQQVDIESDKFTQNCHKARTLYYGQDADDESSSEGKNGTGQQDASEVKRPRNPYILDETSVARRSNNHREVEYSSPQRDSKNSVASSIVSDDDSFQSLQPPKNDDHDTDGDVSRTKDKVVPKAYKNTQTEDAPKSTDEMVMKSAQQLKRLMDDYVNFSLLETNRDFIKSNTIAHAQPSYLQALRKECCAFYDAYSVNGSSKNNALKVSLVLLLVTLSDTDQVLSDEEEWLKSWAMNALPPPVSRQTPPGEITNIFEDLLHSIAQINFDVITCNHSLGCTLPLCEPTGESKTEDLAQIDEEKDLSNDLGKMEVSCPNPPHRNKGSANYIKKNKGSVKGEGGKGTSRRETVTTKAQPVGRVMASKVNACQEEKGNASNSRGGPRIR
jgi:hypothetical protein